MIFTLVSYLFWYLVSCMIALKTPLHCCFHVTEMQLACVRVQGVVCVTIKGSKCEKTIPVINNTEYSNTRIYLTWNRSKSVVFMLSLILHLKNASCPHYDKITTVWQKLVNFNKVPIIFTQSTFLFLLTRFQLSKIRYVHKWNKYKQCKYFSMLGQRPWLQKKQGYQHYCIAFETIYLCQNLTMEITSSHFQMELPVIELWYCCSFLQSNSKSIALQGVNQHLPT